MIPKAHRPRSAQRYTERSRTQIERLHPMQNSRYRFLWCATATALSAIGFLGCSRQPSAQTRSREDTAKSIATVTVEQETVRQPVDVVGTLAAVDQVTISSQADGAVNRILADLGDRVRS